MVSNHKELYLAVQEAAKTYMQESGVTCDFQLAKNGSCQIEHKGTGNRFVFMMAKLGDEHKIGYAFFDKGEAQPDWIEDMLTSEFSAEKAVELIKEHLANPAPSY